MPMWSQHRLYPAVASKFVGHPPMTLPRRQFLHLAAGAAALPAMPRIARAQPYPSRPVRIIIPFPAGQATDTVARLMGLVSRVAPVHTAVRNCTRDEGRSFEVGNQVLISSHRKLLFIEVMRFVPACREGRSFARSGSQTP